MRRSKAVGIVTRSSFGRSSFGAHAVRGDAPQGPADGTAVKQDEYAPHGHADGTAVILDEYAQADAIQDPS
jgi:hypothetical protein